MTDLLDGAQEAAKAYTVAHGYDIDLCLKGPDGEQYASLEVRVLKDNTVLGEFVLTANGFVPKETKTEYPEMNHILMGLNARYNETTPFI